MSFLIAILILLLLGAVVLVVGAPFRARAYEGETAEDISSPGAAAAQAPTTLSAEVARDEVESAREAKYREIRDAEMDFRTGKLSREDYEAIDTQLRAEALAILNRLEVSELQREDQTQDPAQRSNEPPE